MFFNTNQFRSLLFCGPYTKPHVVGGLSKHYHMRFDQKLRHGICTIFCIPCACSECTYIKDKPYIHGLTLQQKPHYQSVIYSTYRPVLVSFNNWNIIILSHKSTRSEAFEEIHQDVLDGVSVSMVLLIQSS